STSVVAQNPGGEQPTATPVATEAPKGRLTVLQNFSEAGGNGSGRVDMQTTKVTLYSFFLTAKERDILIKGITLTRIGLPSFDDTLFIDARLATSTTGVVQALPSLKDGQARFFSENGLFAIAKDQTVALYFGGSMNGFQWNEQVVANYAQKPFGFSLKKTSDIQTNVPVEIISAFPLDGPLFKLCCYEGTLAPNAP
ncbi:MAG: hypothetical protein AAB400_04390, partial [Patescibacteria group bacterium]